MEGSVMEEGDGLLRCWACDETACGGKYGGAAGTSAQRRWARPAMDVERGVMCELQAAFSRSVRVSAIVKGRGRRGRSGRAGHQGQSRGRWARGGRVEVER